LLVNAHDGTSAYQLFAACTALCQWPLCRLGDFALIRIPHRANVVADVVAVPLRYAASSGT